MRQLVRRSMLVLLSWAPVVLLSCAPVMAQADVRVFAAASLKNALDPVASEYKAANGRTVSLSYAASSALARQIEQGAPADLFLSADIDWVDYLDGRGLLKPGSRRNLFGNRIVLVAPAGSAKPLALVPGALAAALDGGRLALANVASVPAGKYAKAALENLGLWAEVVPRLAQAENVRAALTFVARGEAPLGIVYATDAKAEPQVAVVAAFPESAHPPIVYPAALTRDARPAAADFLAFLAGPAGARIFSREGFVILGRSAP